MNVCDSSNIVRLTAVARYTVQYEDIALCEDDPVQKKREYLLGKGKMLILKQKTVLQDTMDKCNFIVIKC